MNKKAYSYFALVPIFISMFFIGFVYNALEPELEKALRQLDNEMVCPPEFSKEGYEICISPKSGIIVTGKLNEDLKISIDSSENTCLINKGTYDNNEICTLESLYEAKKLYITGATISSSVSGKKLLSYTKSGQYVRLLRIAKVIPKI